MQTRELTAGGLRLRPWQSGDGAVLLEVGADPQVQRWTELPVPYRPADARAFLDDVAPRGWASGRDLTWAVCEGTSGRVLASVALRMAYPAGVWDVGFWCRPGERGRGVVAEALRAVCRWAFADLGAVRVEWSAQVGNWDSRRAAEQAGFRFEGVLRAGVSRRGTPVDGWVGAVLPGDPLTDTAVLPPLGRPGDGAVALRRPVEADVPDVQRACDDLESARWLPLPSPYTREDAATWVQETVPGEWADGKAASMLAVDADTGALLGAVALTLGRADVGEVGYWTAPWARCRGVATRATRLACTWGFDTVGLARIELLADVGNHASQRVAERAGFAREGVARAARPLPRDDGRTDMVVFARLPGEACPASAR